MQVIFLNGASSAGKSEIAKAIQEQSSDHYLRIGIDSFIKMMPSKVNDLVGDSVKDGFYWQEQQTDGERSYRIRAGFYGKKVNDGYRKTVLALINSGLNVIVDDICDGQEELKIWQELLEGINCLYVGVYCKDARLKEREKERGNRKLGSAIEQQARVHSGIQYDLTIETSGLTAKECADKILGHDKASKFVEYY